jgi:nitrogen fixation protein NifB
MIERQLAALKALQKYNITTKVNCIVIPGINDHCVTDIAQLAASLGVARFNPMPLIPTPDTEFSHLPRPDHELMQKIRWEVSQHLPVMRHCGHCRADAAGRIGEQTPQTAASILSSVAAGPLIPAQTRPYVAVASREGVFVNAHLGQVEELFIYHKENDTTTLVSVRSAPPKGGGNERWKTLGEYLADCHTLLVNRAGEAPRKILEGTGLRVVETEGMIDNLVSKVLEGQTLPIRSTPKACGSGCGGNGMGCG